MKWRVNRCDYGVGWEFTSGVIGAFRRKVIATMFNIGFASAVAKFNINHITLNKLMLTKVFTMKPSRTQPMNREQKINSLIHEIRYQKSLGYHTWGKGSCGHNARGCRTCVACLTIELSKLVGEDNAAKFTYLTGEINALHNSMIEGDQ